MDGYIRVSRRMGRKGPGYISPTVQREAIERWAEYRGVHIAAWHEDEDESGGTHDRPGLNRAIERALAGHAGGIVSWKIDRFSRFTEGGLRDLRRLEDAGARLAFVTEDIDTSGPMGKLVYTMLLAFAEFFLDNIKASWVAAKTRAVGRGAHIGPTPWGYVREDDGTLTVDPVTAPIVREAFALAAREGLHAALDYLSGADTDRRWTTTTVRRLLALRTYLGEVNYGDLAASDAHEALVSQTTFDLVQLRLKPSAKRRAKGDFPLSGFASCGTCGHHLVGARGGADGRRLYRCGAAVSGFTGEPCTEPASMSADLLEAHVISELRAAWNAPKFAVGDEPVGGDLDSLRLAVEEADAEITRFASDPTAARVLGHEAWTAALVEREVVRDDAQVAYNAALESVTPMRVIEIDDAMWESLDAEEMREVVTAALSSIVVKRGRMQPAEKVALIPVGAEAQAA
jgi:DNA invertase Pin-like site-specific DNA recombinase